jgi:hypothetical protein
MAIREIHDSGALPGLQLPVPYIRIITRECLDDDFLFLFTRLGDEIVASER